MGFGRWTGRSRDTANSEALTENAAAALATSSSQLSRGAPTNSAPRFTIVAAATIRVSELSGTRFEAR